MFSIGQADIEGKREAKINAAREEQIPRIRSEESVRETREWQIANFTGSEKRAFLLKERIDEILARANALREGARAAMQLGVILTNASKENERGWGFSAGMANAIGGTGAAVAVASEIVAENAAIRARNAERAKQYQFLYDDSFKVSTDAYRVEQKARPLQKQLEMTAIKLTDENHPIRELFDAIKFGQIKTSASISGAITIKTTAKVTQRFSIANGVDGLIDGSVCAEVYEGGIYIGQAYLNLPLYGIDNGAGVVELSGICTSTKPNTKYTVKMAPKSLWLMEL
jgi:hypothetical protein